MWSLEKGLSGREVSVWMAGVGPVEIVVRTKGQNCMRIVLCRLHFAIIASVWGQFFIGSQSAAFPRFTKNYVKEVRAHGQF